MHASMHAVIVVLGKRSDHSKERIGQGLSRLNAGFTKYAPQRKVGETTDTGGTRLHR
jgi:hypothetical protein